MTRPAAAAAASYLRRSAFSDLLSVVNSGGRLQDISLALMAVAVVALMVLPLPTLMLDALIAVNIGLSIMLLMMSLYVPSLLSLSTFPTLLLLTTLLRLSLNIATTRAILLTADAGQIIETFGKLVVGGNLIVGVVVFVIIALVQFIVIAKGAERVAEVGARFTLDALPGRQMSIDAELRAGILNKEESRAKREELQRESQLYGAMDGAMKFVKGDAIAGILIALVNIVAGISIGILMKDMSVSEAATKYSILTVGDGLVSQIPSLFVSLAAGILITRVGGADNAGPSGLGSQIARQLTAQPKALWATAGVLLVCTVVPGFPWVQFLGLAALLGLAGWWLDREVRQAPVADPMIGSAFHRDGIIRRRTSNDIDAELVATYALSLRVGTSLSHLLNSNAIHDEVARARRLATRRLGVAFPGMAVSVDEDLAEEEFVILVNDVPAVRSSVVLDGLVVSAPNGDLVAKGIPVVTPTDQEANSTWVGADYEQQVLEAGLSYRTELRFIGDSIAGVLSKHAADFLGVQETSFLLSEAEKAFPDLVAEAQRGMPITRLTEVLKRLVQEDIPIRNLREILQAMLEWAPREKDVVPLTEYARNALAPQITFKYGGRNKTIYGVLLSPAVEEQIRSSIQVTAIGNYLALAPDVTNALTQRIAHVALTGKRPTGALVVLIASMDIRRYVKRMIELDLPDLPVLSYQDLTGDARVIPLGQVEPATTSSSDTESKPLGMQPIRNSGDPSTGP